MAGTGLGPLQYFKSVTYSPFCEGEFRWQDMFHD